MTPLFGHRFLRCLTSYGGWWDCDMVACWQFSNGAKWMNTLGNPGDKFIVMARIASLLVIFSRIRLKKMMLVNTVHNVIAFLRKSLKLMIEPCSHSNFITVRIPCWFLCLFQLLGVWSFFMCFYNMSNVVGMFGFVFLKKKL